MKTALLTLGQALLFFFIFAVGSFLHPFNLHWMKKAATVGTTFFVADGLLLAIGVFLAIVIIQAVRRRTCDTRWTVIAFLFAVAVGYAIRLGFVTQDF
jgi:hypothetical protein